MRFYMVTLVAVVLCLFCLDLQTHVADAALVFDVYRLLQYEHNNVQVGSQKAASNFVGTVPGRENTAARVTMVMRMGEVTPKVIREIAEDRKTSTLLILLPEELPADAEEVHFLDF